MRSDTLNQSLNRFAVDKIREVMTFFFFFFFSFFITSFFFSACWFLKQTYRLGILRAIFWRKIDCAPNDKIRIPGWFMADLTIISNLYTNFNTMVCKKLGRDLEKTYILDFYAKLPSMLYKNKNFQYPLKNW